MDVPKDHMGSSTLGVGSLVAGRQDLISSLHPSCGACVVQSSGPVSRLWMVMSKKHITFRKMLSCCDPFRSQKTGTDAAPCHGREEVYVPLNFLTDLSQKWEGTNIRTTSGIFLERKKNKEKSCLVQGMVLQLQEALPLAPGSGFLNSPSAEPRPFD